MRPGKPLMFGNLAYLPVLGLPGNPVSALVCAVFFLFPGAGKTVGIAGRSATAHPRRARRKTAGQRPPRRPSAGAAGVGDDGTLLATAFERQDSAMLRLLTQADALILRTPHAPAAAVGDAVEVIRLDALGM